MGVKNRISSEVEVDVKYMETNFGGQGLFSFGNFFPFFVCLTEFGGHGPSDFGDFAPFLNLVKFPFQIIVNGGQ